jgi:integrase
MPGSGTPVIQITRRRLTTTISCSCVVSSEEWNNDRNEVVIPEKASSKRKKELTALIRKLKKEVRQLKKTAKMMEAQGDFSAKELARHVKKQKQGRMFCEYANQKVEELSEENRHETAHLLKYAIRSFFNFLDKRDIRIDLINADLMKNYEQHLLKNNRAKNTVSAYMRSLRTIYNRAFREKIFIPKNQNNKPFSGVFTGNDKTAKRAIDVESISQLAKLEIDKSNKKENLFLDIFLFCFFTHGMSFIDLINLKKENICGKYIRYRRQKTDQEITIELENCMKIIIEHYADKNSKYIFPILRELEKIEDTYLMWKKTRSALALYNRKLQKLAVKAGIEERLTSYVARHSWATAASREGIPLPVISRGMGHESMRTTELYIAQVNSYYVGHANRKILERLVS